MKLDQIGFWSEIKIEIIKQFTSAYRKKRGLEHYLLAKGESLRLWRGRGKIICYHHVAESS